MKRVLLDVRMVTDGEALHGIARYALELALRLPALAPDLEFQLLTAPDGLPFNLGKLAPALPQVRCAADFLSAAEQPALAWTLARARPALFHATSFSLPALWPGRLVATLHDANHLALRQNYGPGRVAYYRAVVGPRARTAQALITVSEFSRHELAQHLSIPPQRFEVIHQGADAARFAPQSAERIAQFRQRRGLPERYFAAVGNPKAHKNLGLLASLGRESPRASHDEAPIALLAGKGAAQALGFPASTLDLGTLPEDELACFYAGAVALLFPSRYEGFGLPALEAMACGCPVVAAATSSLPEVVGDAGLLVDPDDRAGWRRAMERFAREPHLRESLAQKGLERARLFSWDECARHTLAVYRRALEG